MACGSINKPRTKVRLLKFALNPLNCELLTFAAHALANIYPIMGSTMLQIATHVVQKKVQKKVQKCSPVQGSSVVSPSIVAAEEV